MSHAIDYRAGRWIDEAIAESGPRWRTRAVGPWRGRDDAWTFIYMDRQNPRRPADRYVMFRALEVAHMVVAHRGHVAEITMKYWQDGPAGCVAYEALEALEGRAEPSR